MTSHGCWRGEGGGDVTTDYAKSTAVFCEGRWGSSVVMLRSIKKKIKHVGRMLPVMGCRSGSV